MMTPEQARDALCDCKLSFVAARTGLHYNTLRDIRDNPQSNPTISTIKKLDEYFTAREKARVARRR